MKIHQYKFRNGFNLILADFPNFNSAYFNFVIKVGSRYEKKGQYGLSHFVEHIFYRKILEQLNNEDWIENYIANSFRAETYVDRTTYGLYAHKNDWRSAVDSLMSVYSGINAEEKDFKAEKEIIKEEIAEDTEGFDYNFYKFVRKKFYQDNSLSNDILGDNGSISRFNRKNFLEFVKKYYAPSNSFLVIAGDINFNEVKKYISEVFIKSAIARNKTNNEFSKKFKKFTYPGDQIQFLKSKGDRAMFNYSFAVAGQTAKDNVVYSFLIDIVRQYLGRRFRAAGFNYTFRAEYSFFEDFGDFNIVVYFDRRKLKRFISEFWNVLAGLKMEVNQNNIDKLKDNKIKNLQLDADFPRLVVDNMSLHLIKSGKVLSLDEQTRIIKDIKQKDLISMIDRLFIENKGNIFISGDFPVADRQMAKNYFSDKPSS